MSLIHFSNANGYQNRYVNDTDSNTVTNTTTETLLDQNYTMPPASMDSIYVGTTIRMTALGTISTGLITLGFRFRLRMGGVSGTILADTGGITILSSLNNAGWLAQSIITVKDLGTSGLITAQSYATMQSGALLAMPSTSTVALDTTVSNDFGYTAQWTTATPNNAFTLRSLFVEFLSPNN